MGENRRQLPRSRIILVADHPWVMKLSRSIVIDDCGFKVYVCSLGGSNLHVPKVGKVGIKRLVHIGLL